MHEKYIEGMIQGLGPVLRDKVRAKEILMHYWRTRIALVWTVESVHRAANERGRALTNAEAVDVLQTLLTQHNPQLGLRWEDLWANIDNREKLGRKLTKAELRRFVSQDIITIQKLT